MEGKFSTIMRVSKFCVAISLNRCIDLVSSIDGGSFILKDDGVSCGTKYYEPTYFGDFVSKHRQNDKV